MVDEMRIGDFSRPVADALKAAAIPASSGLAATEVLDKEVRQDEAALKPMVAYEERLKGIDVKSV